MGENIDAARLVEFLTVDVMDTAAEADFDRLTVLTARLLRTPIALLSLFDARRQWFKSAVGAQPSDVPLAESMCWRLVSGPDPQSVVVLDTLLDDRLRENPLVTGTPNVRFYAGVPLTTPAGICVGALCAVDLSPRDKVAPEDMEALRLLANLAGDLLHTRRQTSLQLAVTRRALLVSRCMKFPDG